MKKSILLILLALSLCLSLCFTLASCGQKAVIKLVIDSGLAYEYELNESPNYTNVKATATYNDGEVKKLTSADLSFGDLDTSSQGTKTLSITYDGFTIEIEVTVKGASLSNGNTSGSGNGASGIGGGSLGNGGTGGGATGGDNNVAGGGNGGIVSGGGTITDDYLLVGAELPATLAAFNATAQQFTNKNVNYVVGDANPFTFRLALAVLDDNDNLVTSVTRYNSISKVFLVDGATETQIGTEYVTVDEVNNTFDFTPAAVGKTFRIETYPAEAALFDIVEESTRDLTVKIVEGYNVTNAKELNLMSNTDTEMHEQYADADQRVLPEHRQGAIAQRYVDQHFGTGYYAQYGDINLKGFVLHCDLFPTINDIPEAYIANKGVAHEGFDDSFAIYDRYIGGTSCVGDAAANAQSIPNSFSIHGNCFTINTSGLPMMSDDPTITPGLSASNSWIFRCKNNPNLRQQSVEQAQAFNFELYPVLLENLRLRDNDPNSNNEAENHRHMYGMNTISINMVDATYDNVIIEAYTISTVISDTNTRLTIKDSVLYNAWQNHIFAWTNNYLQGFFGENYEAMAPWDTIIPMQIDIINSKLTKTGGPVILQQCSNMHSPHNENTGVEITVDTVSEIYTYVTGNEAWFEAYSFAKTYATNIKSLDTPLKNATGNTASITTTRPGYGEERFLNMAFASLNGQAKYTVKDPVNGDKVLMDSKDAMVTMYKEQGIPAAGGQTIAQLGAPLLQSTVDPSAAATFFHGAMGTPADRVFDLNILQGGTGVVAAPFAQGNYINMYYGPEVSVLLEYFH